MKGNVQDSSGRRENERCCIEKSCQFQPVVKAGIPVFATQEDLLYTQIQYEDLSKRSYESEF